MEPTEPLTALGTPPRYRILGVAFVVVCGVGVLVAGGLLLWLTLYPGKEGSSAKTIPFPTPPTPLLSTGATTSRFVGTSDVPFSIGWGSEGYLSLERQIALLRAERQASDPLAVTPPVNVGTSTAALLEAFTFAGLPLAQIFSTTTHPATHLALTILLDDAAGYAYAVGNKLNYARPVDLMPELAATVTAEPYAAFPDPVIFKATVVAAFLATIAPEYSAAYVAEVKRLASAQVALGYTFPAAIDFSYILARYYEREVRARYAAGTLPKTGPESQLYTAILRMQTEAPDVALHALGLSVATSSRSLPPTISANYTPL